MRSFMLHEISENWIKIHKFWRMGGLAINILKDENIESHGLKTSYPIHNERATGES